MAAAQKIRGGAPLPAKLAGLLREAKWLALVAAAGYLLLILLTHHATDPGWSRSATAAVVQNAGGRVGVGNGVGAPPGAGAAAPAAPRGPRRRTIGRRGRRRTPGSGRGSAAGRAR